MALFLSRYVLSAVILLTVCGCIRKPYRVDYERGTLGGSILTSQRSSLKGASPIFDTLNDKPVFYVGSRKGALFCFDANHAQPIWRTVLDAGVEAQVAVSGDSIYVGTLKGSIYALDKNNGHVLWRQDSESEILSQPFVFQNKLFVVNILNQVMALDANDGTFLWRYREEEPTTVTLRGTAPIVKASGESIYAGFSTGALVALDIESGGEKWREQIGGQSRYIDVDSAPVLSHGQVLVVAVSGPLAAYNEAGELLWKIDDIKTHVDLHIDGDTIYVVDEDKRVSALTPKGTLAWQTNIRSKGIPTAVTTDGSLLLVATSDGWLEVLNRADGASLWQYKVAERLSGDIAKMNKNSFVLLTGSQNLLRFEKQGRFIDEDSIE